MAPTMEYSWDENHYPALVDMTDMLRGWFTTCIAPTKD